MTAQRKLIGNIQATVGDLLKDTMEERKRGYATEKEAWAELKERIENADGLVKQAKDLHKDMWSAAKENNEAAFGAYSDEMARVCQTLAALWLNAAVLAKIEVEA